MVPFHCCNLKKIVNLCNTLKGLRTSHHAYNRLNTQVSKVYFKRMSLVATGIYSFFRTSGSYVEEYARHTGYANQCTLAPHISLFSEFSKLSKLKDTSHAPRSTK
ncbi:hypothetical protein GDO81_029554 [Engystomops pustulosus]|uniref:Uncharacterized protein n=1 Tax=Engystomops pustulosus TaxID=76066 RepID=A0AAV6Z1M3_ENGPU|nr:hypothetical protein GDO81_029554 [Engystomops pustulosus]